MAFNIDVNDLYYTYKDILNFKLNKVTHQTFIDLIFDFKDNSHGNCLIGGEGNLLFEEDDYFSKSKCKL